MGYMIRISCTGCGLDEEHCEDVGMNGIAYRACACPSCGAVVTLEHNRFRGDPEPLLFCPTCGGPVEPVVRSAPAVGGDRPRPSRRRGRVAQLVEQATRSGQDADREDDVGATPPGPTRSDATPRTPCPRCGGPLEVDQIGLWD